MFSASENLKIRQYKKQVVEWVEETIPEDVMDEGVNVMAMQVSCKDPGCVPLETQIFIIFPKSNVELMPGLPESKGQSYKTKIFKPIAEVEQMDVLDALPPSFAGGLRTTERLCLMARDKLFGQIGQLFERTEDRKLLAQYLQTSLNEYMNHDCVPPEQGQEYTTVEQQETTTDGTNNLPASIESLTLASTEQSAGKKRPRPKPRH